MMEASQAAAERIRQAILPNPPWIDGVCTISPEDARIFYHLTARQAKWLDLSAASSGQLQGLAAACQPATFGRDSEDVLDESYRKARQLDTSDFSNSFNPFTYGIIEHIQRELLPPTQHEQPLTAELYKLNVYDEGSFFKAHKDTPRGEGMIGSLVVVFPTPHEGGEGGSLLLRHGKEHSFDSGSLLKDRTQPSVAYVAFFSDVEHEVTQVTSGFRVALTWNLYLNNDAAPQASPFPPLSQTELTTALSDALKDPAFIGKGGYIGFGLDFQYPVKTDENEPSVLSDILPRLKGTDAVLCRSLQDVGLQPSLKLVYAVEYDNGTSFEDVLVMSSEPVDLGMDLYDRDDPRPALLSGFYEAGAKVTYAYGCKRPEGIEARNATPVLWVTRPTAASRFRTAYAAYGNEAMLSYVYADLVLVAKVV